MLAPLLVLTLVAAAQAPSAPVETGKPKLMVLSLTPAGGAELGVAESLSEVVAAEALRAGYFEVQTQKDIATLLGLERQKQLLGCSEESSSCLTELAGALGARFVLSGSLARLGEAWQLNLQTNDAVRAQPIGRATRIANDLKALRELIPWALAEATATPAPQTPSRVLPLTIAGVGAGGVIIGGLILLQSLLREEGALNELRLSQTQPGFQLKPAAYYADEARAIAQQRVISAIVLGVGAAALTAGLIWNARLGRAESRVAVLFTGNGMAFAGAWP